MIITDFYSFMSANSAIDALVDGRIFPWIIPEGETEPALTYELDSDFRQQLLDSTQSSLRFADFTVNCWDLTYVGAHTLASTVTDELLGYSGSFGTVTAEQIQYERGAIDMPHELDTGRYGVSLSFEIAYYLP